MRAWHDQQGITLLELMFAGVVAVGILASGFMIVTSTEKAHAVNGQSTETMQNVRVAADLLARDIKQAGYGMIAPVGNCRTAIVPQDNTVGGADTGPDRISVVVPVGNPVANPVDPAWAITAPIGPGFNQLPLSAAIVTSMQSRLGLASLVGLSVTVGGASTATVQSVAGGLLTITPVAAPAAFGLNEPVYLLQCITYQVIPPPDPNGLCDGRSPCLVRGVAAIVGGVLDCNTPGSLCMPVADDIEDIQFAYGCDGCSLLINGGVPDNVIDDQAGSAAGFDALDFVSNNDWATLPMTPDKIHLVQMSIVGRQRVADQGVGGATVQSVQSQLLQVADHNHAAGVFAAGDVAAMNPPYTAMKRRLVARTLEIRNSGL